MGSVGTIDMLRAAPAGSPLRDHVFLGFMARATVDPLGLSVPQPLSRLFGGRVGRFTAPIDWSRRVSLRRQFVTRLRGWVVFHNRQVRVVQSCALGLVLLTVWRPVQERVAESVVAAAPPVASTPSPAPAAVPDPQPTIPDPAPVPPSVNPPATRLPITVAPRSGAPGNRGGAPIAPTAQGGLEGAQQSAGGVVQGPSPVQGAGDGTPAAGNAADEAGGAGGRGTATARAPVQEAIGRPGGAAVPPPNNNETAIQQLLASYASAMESLNPSAVADVYPNVDTRALAAAFREYASLDEEIVINRIDLAADGQSATVNAVLSITQVVKIGRAAPVTRNVVFAVRRQGDRWVIDSIK